MTTSEQVQDIATALAKAQATMKNATLNKMNPHFKSKYADLAGIRDAVVPALTAQGIAIVQTLDASALMTRLIHTSGQWIESACPIPPMPDMQKMGSAITYARRYSLSAICGISADDDDDAEAAQPASPPRAAHVAPVIPPGYDNWLLDFEAVADEGMTKLIEFWQGKDLDPVAMAGHQAKRRFLEATDPAKGQAIRKKAEAADTKKPVTAKAVTR